MTTGETLLNLNADYHAALEARNPEFAAFGGEEAGREPTLISADYEDTIRQVVGEMTIALRSRVSPSR